MLSDKLGLCSNRQTIAADQLEGNTVQACKGGFVVAGVMACVSSAHAENLIPNVSPNIVLTCLQNGKEASACTFGCANMLGVVGKTSTSGFGVTKASRVEMYTGQKSGRDDQHIWVAYRHGDETGFSNVGFAFVSSTFTCQWPGEIRSGDNKISWQWRIDKFEQ